jgi:hypothetical protein
VLIRIKDNRGCAKSAWRPDAAARIALQKKAKERASPAITLCRLAEAAEV